MNRFHLLLRNLRYFRGVNIAVILGMAVATAVLTGALMVGDSVRGSLADLAIRRLGPVDYALISTRFFDQTLADRLTAEKVTPTIIIRGGASNESEAGKETRTADVQIAAIGGTQPPANSSELPVPRGHSIINDELAKSLGIDKPDATLLLSVPTQGDAPREAALARRGHDDVQNQLRTDAAAIDDRQDFIALFNPNPSQRVPRNAWANLQDLQGAIEQEGRVNVLFASAKDANEKPEDAVKALNGQVAEILQTQRDPSDHSALNYYGLTVKPVGDDESCVFARDIYIAPPVRDAARKAADALHVRLREVSVNLVNLVKNVSSDEAQTRKPLHYAVAAGISSLDEGTMGDDEIAINQWTADQLNAKVGDKIAIDFYMRQPGGDLTDASKVLPSRRLTFTVKYVLPMSGLGADPKLAPDYKGLTDATSVADWDPPEGLAIDKKLATKADEDYWHKWRAAPKIFVNFQTAGKLWGGVYGDVTGLRIPTADAARFEKQLLAELKPESMGLFFRPIKAEQVSAASGGTDFSMFFLMFSFFLIVAAALLVAMLFRLNVEQRARQLGLMSAVGFSPGALRRMALAEGLILAVIGGVLGLAGAVGYTSLIMLGLRTWWIGAVGTTAMTLHVIPLTLVYGLVGSLFVAFLAILWAVWRIGKAQPARLLAGGWGTDIRRRGRGLWLVGAANICVVGGLILVGVALAGKISAEQGFGGGAVILCGLLAWLAAQLRPRRHPGASFVGAASLTRLGIRNAGRHTARGVLSVGLIGFAAFTLITVAAVKQNGIQDPGKRDSETGGYRLILSAGIPLSGDLNTASGRRLLGIRDPDNAIYHDVHFTPLRQWAGQDISCLNLTKPNTPTILGMPAEFISRGGFVPGNSVDNKVPLWSLLDSDQGDAIPVICDSDTQEYVLQIELGGIIPITDQLGVQRKLKLVGTVAHSIFQGQLLMGESNFLKLFPAQSGFGVELIDTSPDKQMELAKVLSTELGDYSVSVDTTVDRLRTYQNVQNTYLETFQTLGALGLMLGTLGLAVVLVRTIIERKAELALLASLGFPSSARVKLILSENTYLLLLGLVLGSISAVIGILPAAWREHRPINVIQLGATLAIVLVIGLVSSSIAVALNGIHIKPADLRRE